MCQIWAGCQVSALICDCSVNFSYTAGPWQPRVCVHVRACAHQHLRITLVLDSMCAGAEMVATDQLPSSRHRQGFLACSSDRNGIFPPASSPRSPSRIIFVPQTCFSLLLSWVPSPFLPGVQASLWCSHISCSLHPKASDYSLKLLVLPKTAL